MGHRRNYHKGRLAVRHYANQPAVPLWLLRWRPNFSRGLLRDCENRGITWGEGDAHLESVDSWGFPTAAVEVLLELGEEDSEAVHDAVPDEVAHEARKDGHPAPEPAVRRRHAAHPRNTGLASRSGNSGHGRLVDI